MKRERLPMVSVYASPEEKKALDLLAALEGRSVSNLVRQEFLKMLKEKGFLKEEFNDKGEVVQTVLLNGEPFPLEREA